MLKKVQMNKSRYKKYEIRPKKSTNEQKKNEIHTY